MNANKRIYLFSHVIAPTLILLTLILSGCTLSFQNISTHGTATDLVDETQTPTNNNTPTLTIPISGLEKK